MPRIKDLSVNQEIPTGVRVPAVAVSSFAPNEANFAVSDSKTKVMPQNKANSNPISAGEVGPVAALTPPALPRGNRRARRSRLRDFAKDPSRHLDCSEGM